MNVEAADARQHHMGVQEQSTALKKRKKASEAVGDMVMQDGQGDSNESTTDDEEELERTASANGSTRTGDSINAGLANLKVNPDPEFVDPLDFLFKVTRNSNGGTNPVRPRPAVPTPDSFEDISERIGDTLIRDYEDQFLGLSKLLRTQDRTIIGKGDPAKYPRDIPINFMPWSQLPMVVSNEAVKTYEDKQIAIFQDMRTKLMELRLEFLEEQVQILDSQLRTNFSEAIFRNKLEETLSNTAVLSTSSNAIPTAVANYKRKFDEVQRKMLSKLRRQQQQTQQGDHNQSDPQDPERLNTRSPRERGRTTYGRNWSNSRSRSRQRGRSTSTTRQNTSREADSRKDRSRGKGGAAGASARP
mmetsp:Transcript_3990/g.6269  ORF Transcript_3990/g.6269 Transcript_3990/m.6269 type:complete len:359 (+) Transcript_3990:1108-2184(+)